MLNKLSSLFLAQNSPLFCLFLPVKVAEPDPLALTCSASTWYLSLIPVHGDGVDANEQQCHPVIIMPVMVLLWRVREGSGALSLPLSFCFLSLSGLYSHFIPPSYLYYSDSWPPRPPPFRLPPEDPQLFKIFKVLFFLEPLNIFAFIFLLLFCWSQHPAHSSCDCHSPTHAALCTPTLGSWSFLCSADAPGLPAAHPRSYLVPAWHLPSHLTSHPPLLSKFLLSFPLTPESCTLLTIEKRT